MNPSTIGIALRTAVFAMIGFMMAQLSIAAALFTVSHAFKGEIWSLMLIAPACAAGFLMFYCLREAASGLNSR